MENGGAVGAQAEGPLSWWHVRSRRLRKVNRRGRRWCRRLVKSQGFYWAVIILVFLNTCVLTSEYAQQPRWLDEFQGEGRIPAVLFKFIDFDDSVFEASPI